MTWPLARLGSRFGLLFEPAERRVMHSALGRFLDEPLDLAVGIVEPDGTERVLPFTRHGATLYGVEQFERINSVTYRGFAESSGLRFELNLHAPFYPRDEKLSTLPALYLEMRVSPAPRIRSRSFDHHPEKARLFIRLRRPGTRITPSNGHINIEYEVALEPRYDPAANPAPTTDHPPSLPRCARVVERIHSLNEGAEPSTDEHGRCGLTLDLPVTREGSGVKWRLVWAAHTPDSVLDLRGKPARFRYNRHWRGVDEVLRAAVENRDRFLTRSRRFEKIVEQSPLTRAQWHTLVLGFHSFLSNTWWCDAADEELYTVWSGNTMCHDTLDVAYNTSLFYLTLWPSLLRQSLRQWARAYREHEPSGGVILHHDQGRGCVIDGPACANDMPVEENCDFLLLLQAYAHWTGDSDTLDALAPIVPRIGDYLLWTDTENCGFPSAGTFNTINDGSPAVRQARHQTYLAVKRACALGAAADLAARSGHESHAARFSEAAAQAVRKIESAAWLDDHYAVCVDRYGDATTDCEEVILVDRLEGWDDYSIYTSNALLLPTLIAQPAPFDEARLRKDIINSFRETLRPYGCGHTSSDDTNIWISQNLWRDFNARYLHAQITELDTRYWDLLVASNTGDNSFGYIDSYIGNELAFHPRGATAFGIFLAGPRLRVDRLDAEYYAVNPDRHAPQRWPLLPLADWEAGKIPICVVHENGRVTLEGEIEPVKIIEPKLKADPELIG